MYLEASKLAPGSTASLVSPMMMCDKGCCLDFGYHLYGQHLGMLNVTEHVENDTNTVFTKEKDQGGKLLFKKNSKIERLYLVCCDMNEIIMLPYS